MQIKVKFNETEITLRRKIIDEFTKQFNSRAMSRIHTLRNSIALLFSETVCSSATVLSLSSGYLKGHFGLISGETKITQLKEALYNSVKVDFQPLKSNINNISGGLTITALQDGYPELTENSDFYYLSGEKQYKIEWLKWLLLEGSNVIISDYSIRFKGSSNKAIFNDSRSGFAIMVKGGTWRVPTTYSGTESNNFITRSLNSSFYSKLTKIIKNELSNL